MGSIGFSGSNVVVAQHPISRDTVLAAYLVSGGALMTLLSLDAGGTWQAWGTVASGLDFTDTGRPGLCWLGGLAVIVYGSGNNLLSRTSPDGKTWGSPVTIASSGPYQGISAAATPAALGTVYASGCTVSGSTVTPTIWKSGDLGANWTPTTGTPPAPTTGAALWFDKRTCRLLWGTGSKTDDDGASWAAP